MRLTPFMILLVVMPLLAACPGSDIPGYNELDQTLVGEEAARKSVYDAAASYVPVQVVFENVVGDPTLPPNLKAAIQQVDREVVAAINDYNAAVAALGPAADGTTEKLTALISVLQRAQNLLLQLQAEGALS